eukprot:3063881-Pyramimonas_sp.AAC.1
MLIRVSTKLFRSMASELLMRSPRAVQLGLAIRLEHVGHRAATWVSLRARGSTSQQAREPNGDGRDALASRMGAQCDAKKEC